MNFIVGEFGKRYEGQRKEKTCTGRGEGGPPTPRRQSSFFHAVVTSFSPLLPAWLPLLSLASVPAVAS